MPQWWVDEPYINLWLADEPLSYLTTYGERMTFRFTYRQRYMLPQPDECPNYYLTGGAPIPRFLSDPYINLMRGYSMTNACWSHNWMMDVVFWDEQWEEQHNNWWYRLQPFQPGYEALVMRPEGGICYFMTNVAQKMLTDPQSRARLQPLSALGYPTTATTPAGADGVYWGEPATNGFRLVYPDGSQDVLSLCQSPVGSGLTTTHAFLTKRVDPQGRVTRVGYERLIFPGSYLAFRVRYVVDPDGRTNTFLYNSNSPPHPWQLTEIDDPYGRKVRLGYNGVLTSIVDAAGMTNSFGYQGPSGWITNLTTPYGTTTFSYYEERDSDVTATNGFSKRALLASEPGGAHQLYYFRHQSTGFVPDSTTNAPTLSGSTFDTGSVGSNQVQLSYRNTFYWDRRQSAAFPTNFYTALQGFHPSLPTALSHLATNDYTRARLRHWLWGTDGISITESLSSERDPAPDPTGLTQGARTWYDYAYKPSPEVEGDAQVSCVARVLPDSSTQYTRFAYWQVIPPYWDGLLHYNESSYTQPNGTAGVRTNWYYYSTNGVDLLGITNSLGQWVKLAYNSNHQIAYVSNALNEVTTFGHDWGLLPLTSVTLPSGLSANLSYYSSNALTANGGFVQTVSLPAIGRSLTFTYTNGLVRTVSDDLGLSRTNFWDGLNRLTGTAFPDGTTISNIYDRLYLGATKDRLGHWTRYGYDELRHLTSTTDARSNVTIYGWCDCGALSSITDPLNNNTFFNYNNQGLVTNIVVMDYNGVTYSSVTNTLDLLGRVTRVADGAGKALTFGYNNQGLPTVVSNALGRLERIVYDAADRPIQITDANNVTVTNQFDLLNRATARSWPDGIGEGFGWATNGLVAYTNRNQKVTRYARDAAGRLTAVTNANQEVTRFGYNSLSQVTDLWDGRTNHTTWGFNEYGWLINKVDALSHEIIRYTRDSNGQVTNRWTPQFTNIGYAYDEVGNLKTVSYPQATIAYAYDALNRLRSMADPIGTTIFSNTPTGNLQSEAGPWSDGTLTYGYTEGLRTSLSINNPLFTINYSYDSAWRLYTLSSPAGSFNYAYDAQRSTLLTTLTLPNSAWITNHYDSLARLDYTALVNKWGHVLDGYSYNHDLLGLRTNITRNLGLTNSSVSVGYDSIGQLASWQAREDLSGPLRLNEQSSYAYDQAGNLRLQTNGGLAQTFNCDSLNQLTNITRNSVMTVSGATPAPAASVTVNGQPAQTYGDFTFARTNVTLSDGNNSFTIAAQSLSGSNVSSTLTVSLPQSVALQWDSNGNLTNDGPRSFCYSPENRLTNITVAGQWKVDFVPDGLGRRRIERDYAWSSGNWQLTNELHFIYDGWLLVQVRDGSNNVLVTYTRGLDLSGSLSGAGGIGGLLARTDGNGSMFYHADGAGNITGLIDGQQNMAARYMYNAFGGLIRKSGAMADVNRIMFSSKEHLPNAGDIYDFGWRDWFTSPHRWGSRDPLGESSDLNLYRGMGNNPINRIDPYGLAWYNPIDWYNGIVNAIADPIARLEVGAAQAQGNAAINAMLSAHDYNGMQDYQLQHPGYGGDITSGNTDASVAIANLASGSATVYLTAATSVTPTAVGAKCVQAAVRTGARNLAEQMALREAEAGAGSRIMQGLIKDPAFPENVWAKMQHVHGDTTIHYWQNLQTGERVGFKFKD
jgi:RHS repeat-associated protein